MTRTATLAPAPHPRAPLPRPEPPPAVGTPPVRALVARFGTTLTVLAAGLVALLTAWSLASTTGWATRHPWPTAVLTVLLWALTVTGWLRGRGWCGTALHAAAWAGPAAALTPLLWAGWVSPAGLVLWAPVTTVFTTALVMAYRPLRLG